MAIALALFLVLTLVVVVLAAHEPDPLVVDLHSLNGLLASAGAVVALLAGALSFVRWRLVGDVSSLRGSAALVVLGLSIVLTDLVPRLRVDLVGDASLRTAGSAATLAVGVLFVATVAQSPVDSRLTLGRMVAIVGAVFATALLLVLAFPSLEVVRSGGVSEFRVPDSYVVHALLLASRLALGVVALARGFRNRSMLWTWFGVMFVGFAISYALRTATSSASDLWYTGGSLALLGALLGGLYGVGKQLERAYLSQRSRLLGSRLYAATSEARRRAELAAQEERAHQARSAVLALQAATRALQAGVAMDPDTADTVRDAIEAEIELLRKLVADREPGVCEEFDVTRVVRAVVFTYRARGLDVTSVISHDTHVVGRPNDTMEVLQTLLDNAMEHAPGAAVKITSRSDTRRVEIRVDDAGAGLEPDRRAKVFERSSGSKRLTGHGLGLYVARRLMRDQGGDLWIEGGALGGACFVCALPAAVPATGHRRSTGEGRGAPR